VLKCVCIVKYLLVEQTNGPYLETQGNTPEVKAYLRTKDPVRNRNYTRRDTECLVRAICCNTLQHVATHCNTLQCNAIHCNSLQFTATHCNSLQHADLRAALHCVSNLCHSLQHSTTRCNTLQHTATHCNSLHHNVTRCNALQRTETY